MNRVCEDCGQEYDDAQKNTICPHPWIMPPEKLAQKDAAIKLLLAKGVRWAHLPAGELMQIESVAWDGMVTIRGWTGQFAPSLFTPMS